MFPEFNHFLMWPWLAPGSSQNNAVRHTGPWWTRPGGTFGRAPNDERIAPLSLSKESTFGLTGSGKGTPTNHYNWIWNHTTSSDFDLTADSRNYAMAVTPTGVAGGEPVAEAYRLRLRYLVETIDKFANSSPLFVRVVVLWCYDISESEPGFVMQRWGDIFFDGSSVGYSPPYNGPASNYQSFWSDVGSTRAENYIALYDKIIPVPRSGRYEAMPVGGGGGGGGGIIEIVAGTGGGEVEIAANGTVGPITMGHDLVTGAPSAGPANALYQEEDVVIDPPVKSWWHRVGDQVRVSRGYPVVYFTEDLLARPGRSEGWCVLHGTMNFHWRPIGKEQNFPT